MQPELGRRLQQCRHELSARARSRGEPHPHPRFIPNGVRPEGTNGLRKSWPHVPARGWSPFRRCTRGRTVRSRMHTGACCRLRLAQPGTVPIGDSMARKAPVCQAGSRLPGFGEPWHPATSSSLFHLPIDTPLLSSLELALGTNDC